MKKLLLSSVSLLVLIIFILSSQTSCKKETVTVTKTDTVFKCTPSLQGLWIGTNTVDGQSNLGNLYWSPVFKPDGTLVCDTKWTGGEQHLSIGTWTLSVDSVKGSYTCVYGIPAHVGVSQSFKGLWNRTTGKIVGTWVNVGLSGSGTFTVNKIN